MSMSIDGIWKSGVWATTVWATGVWAEVSVMAGDTISNIAQDVADSVAMDIGFLVTETKRGV